jgi:hypothetical protein
MIGYVRVPWYSRTVQYCWRAGDDWHDHCSGLQVHDSTHFFDAFACICTLHKDETAK